MDHYPHPEHNQGSGFKTASNDSFNGTRREAASGSMEAVANKLIIVILIVSALIAAGGIFYYRSTDAIPFVIGVSMAAALNVSKVLLLRFSIACSTGKDPNQGKMLMQSAILVRTVLTVVVLLVAGLLHGRGVNLVGTVIALFAYPIANYSMHFFLKDTYQEHMPAKKDAVSEAIENIENLSKGD